MYHTSFNHVNLLYLGKPRAMKKIKDWSPHIIQLPWYCSSSCGQDNTTSDDEALRLMKVHIC